MKKQTRITLKKVLKSGFNFSNNYAMPIYAEFKDGSICEFVPVFRTVGGKNKNLRDWYVSDADSALREARKYGDEPKSAYLSHFEMWR